MNHLLRLAIVAALTALFVVPVPAVQPTGSAGWTTDGWVTLDGSLLAGPGANYEVTGSVDAGMRVRVDRCTGRWCQIHTQTAWGWLPLSNVSFGQEPGGLLRGPEFDIARGGTGKVCFYDGEGFSGTFFCARTGRVFKDLALYGVDNSISSIEVGDGVSAVVCRDRGFRSYCETVAVSKSSLSGLLSNGISSIRVY